MMSECEAILWVRGWGIEGNALIMDVKELSPSTQWFSSYELQGRLN